MYKEIDINRLEGNVFSMIGKQWMLITAGDKQRVNTMTASWGGLGILWNKPVATCYIRPQRFTYGLTESNDTFSLTFLGEQYRQALNFCGVKSGRDCDKLAETGLTAGWSDDTPYIEQGDIILICRKLYAQDIDPACFLDASIEGNYAAKDYHRMYIAEITKCLVREG